MAAAVLAKNAGGSDQEGQTQKGVAWECPWESGVRARGPKVRASWTAHKRGRG